MVTISRRRQILDLPSSVLSCWSLSMHVFLYYPCLLHLEILTFSLLLRALWLWNSGPRLWWWISKPVSGHKYLHSRRDLELNPQWALLAHIPPFLRLLGSTSGTHGADLECSAVCSLTQVSWGRGLMTLWAANWVYTNVSLLVFLDNTKKETQCLPGQTL